MKYFVVFFIGLLCSCHSKQVASENVQRMPDSSTSGWQEIQADKPETFLDTRDSMRRLQMRQQKTHLLKQCGVTFLSDRDFLETDLLFIRIENWSLDRLIKEYDTKVTEPSLKCLQNSSFDGV